jgi:hypothetical protein
VRVVDEERRRAVLEEVMEGLGPSDGTVVSTPLTGPSTLKLTEDVIGAVTSTEIFVRNIPFPAPDPACLLYVDPVPDLTKRQDFENVKAKTVFFKWELLKIYFYLFPCCGSGSVGSICFWASRIRIR